MVIGATSTGTEYKPAGTMIQAMKEAREAGLKTDVSYTGEITIYDPRTMEVVAQDVRTIEEAKLSIQAHRLGVTPTVEQVPVTEPTRLGYTVAKGFVPPERMAGETASKYHARVLREEIVWEREQPYVPPPIPSVYKEYGVIPKEEKVIGYEAYEIKPKPISPTISRIKATAYRYLAPKEIYEVRAMEKAGVSVPFGLKARVEAQKFLITLPIAYGAGVVTGAGVGALIPQAVKAMKVRTALIFGIPAVYGAVKGIQAGEYGITAGAIIGGVAGYPRGYKYGAERIRPYLRTRFKPIGVEAIAETVVRRLPEGEKYLGVTRGKYKAKIGKKVYTGRVRAVTGIEPSPVVKQPRMYVYKGEVYAKVAKWDVGKIKSFAKRTGLTVAEIKSRVGTGELSSKQFIKYTKPVKAEYVGAVAPKRADYLAETIIKAERGPMRAGLEYGRKYIDMGKTKFYKAVGREYKPRFKTPSAEIKVIQKVTFKPSKIPEGYVGFEPYQRVPTTRLMRKVVTPQVQKITGPQILKAVTKTVRTVEAKRIAKQFTPQRRLVPFVTPTKIKYTTLQKQAQRLREVADVKQRQIQVQRQKQIITPIQIVVPQQIQKRITPAIIPVGITPPVRPPPAPYIPPPFIPMPPLPLGFISGRRKVIPVRVRYGYTPSYRALVFKIFGKRARPAFRGRYTGFQMRPIPRTRKLVTITKRRKKKRR